MTLRFSVLPAAALALALLAGSGTAMADGSKIPYAAAQAADGGKLYSTKCAACHGDNLEGNAGPALTGPNLVTLSKNTKLTVSDLFTFMSQQMPLNEPASLSKAQYTSIMAYILKVNHYPAGAPLTFAAALNSKATMTTLKAK